MVALPFGVALVRHGDALLDGIDLSTTPTVAGTTPEVLVGLALLGVFLVEHLMDLQFALRNGRPATGV